MKASHWSTGFLFVTLLIASLSASAADKEQQRQAIRKISQQILSQLYKAQPAAKKHIQSSAGYAVFSNFGMKILFAGGGSGQGMAVNQATKKETFMKMVEVQAGLGFGVKKFRLVFVFENQSTLKSFISSGWEAGAQTTAAAKSGSTGAAYQGALSVSPGVWLYQMTEQGLAAEATIKGTKYYKNDDLN
ncbi:lipid-binding SYLF domain-containing protein [Bdellovibrio svalbardensis]|uniref:YSC84-related protein n=1 Tax=Bdellovibrio svalbardensis TaxID=2972972 RepID=A0ABT6DM30_9BACT|nr:YSC84-related protein [Bdellovibrio svalbardensis]MDG0817935.1 YSC84-related protein [Bdellovibrio svalbardensis]